MQQVDTLIIGAGAAGLMCAATAGYRGKSVVVVDMGKKPGRKILISGGGRCNFTNENALPENYLCTNPHFIKSALSRYHSQDFIELTSFTKGCELDSYRIASFHIRNGQINRYGEDSAAIDYSYFHEQLNEWMIDRMNNQKDEGPAENLALYLSDANYPEQAIISIGATRYTEFGETNFLQSGDESIVVVYDGQRYDSQEIENMAASKTFSQSGISVLSQMVR